MIEDLNSRLPKENIWITELVALSGGKPVGGNIAPGRADATPPPIATPVPIATPGATRDCGEPAIDGILVRGLYLYNPKQQEIVVDYFRNLVGSPFFAIDPNNQAKVIQPDHAEQHRVGVSVRAAARLEEAGEIAMNWFQQNRFLGTFLAILGVATLGALYFLWSAKSNFDDGESAL